MPELYDVPSAAGGDQGLEGFALEVGGSRVGRVAALNDTPDGLVLVFDTGDAYRLLPARFLAQIETAGRVVRLTPAGEDAFAASPEVQPRIRGADTPQLVRHMPRRFDRLLVRGEQHASRSRLWYVGGPFLVVGAVGVMFGSALTAEGVGGSMRWLWVVAPLIVLVVGAWAFWAAMSRDSPRHLTRREKVADSFTAILGITPRTRRRG